MNPSFPARFRATLADELDAALDAGEEALAPLGDARPRDARDRLLTLLLVHDLHTAPLDRLGERVRFQHHRVVAGLKGRLESELVADLDRYDGAGPPPLGAAPAAMRALAAASLVPDVYRWVAEAAKRDELVEFLALEGGPDGGFDDLVAACQIGLSGEAKLELARNYWDEMGNGALAEVHTELHRQLAVALDLPTVPRADQPIEALERAAVGSLLATNRYLQPEMVGALGLLELQAGPRCRKVLDGLRRVGAPAAALPFYEVHAEVDPRHGRDWVDHVVAPLATDAEWAARILRGARWRAATNARFFDAMAARFLPGAARRQAS